MRFIFPFFCFFLFINQLSYSQVSEVASFNVKFSPVVNPSNSLDTLQAISYEFEIQDTTKVIKVHMKVGSTDGASNIFNQVINYPNPSGLLNNQYFVRNGKNVKFTIGHFHLLADYFYEMRLEGPTGNLSNKKAYHFNN